MKPQYILGINSAYHESSAALIRDGILIAAVEEERFNRIKHAKTARTDNPDELPYNAINYCLEFAKIAMCDVDIIAYSFVPDERLKNIDISEYYTEGSWGSRSGELEFYNKMLTIPNRLSKYYNCDIEDKLHWVSHHLAHAASAFFVSQYDESTIVIVDGIGEVATCWLGYGKGNKIHQIKEILFPNSIGFLWEKIAEYLGFTEYDAGKVMGLASYGDWRVHINGFERFISYDDDGIFKIDNDIMRFRTGDFSEIEKVFGIPKMSSTDNTRDQQHIAAALQKITEKILLRIIDYTEQKAATKIKIENLCCAGGVMLNCIANTTFLTMPYNSVFIPSAPHDAGTAIGAAYYVYNQVLDNPRGFVYDHAYWGPKYSDAEIELVLHDYNLRYDKVDNIEEETAKLIAEGNVILWFQGRMEFGPRALGNRSFLADPRRKDMQDTINHKIKNREWFRPFAPAVTEERMKDFFYARKYLIADRFMIFSVMTKFPEKLPAVTHIDDTSRVQTVSADTNPKFHRLLKEFETLTGVPVLLNTSYNVQEPIVCSPEDAVQTFLKTKVEYLVIGDYLVTVKSEHLHEQQTLFATPRIDAWGLRDVILIGNEAGVGCPFKCVGCGVYDDAEIVSPNENLKIIYAQIASLKYRISKNTTKYYNGYHLSVYNNGNITDIKELCVSNFDVLLNNINELKPTPEYISIESRGVYVTTELLDYIRDKKLKYHVHFTIGVEALSERGATIFGKPGIKSEVERLITKLDKYNNDNKTRFGLDAGFVFLPEFYADNRNNIEQIKCGFQSDLMSFISMYHGTNLDVKILIHPYYKIPKLHYESTEKYMEVIQDVVKTVTLSSEYATAFFSNNTNIFIGTVDEGYETEQWKAELVAQ